MRCFVTGGAGFIGSNLVDRLLSLGHKVTIYDNFSTGSHSFLEKASRHDLFYIRRGDLLDIATLKDAIKGNDFVFHMAANADVRFGTERPERDLEQNTIATFNVLEAMRSHNIKRIVFASSGSVYGEPELKNIPTKEKTEFPIQTSLYGASKLACEGLIQAYCEGFDFQGYIFRFVSILGERYTHGHIFDFMKRLKINPQELRVLGDGQQRKSYLYVQDCVNAIITTIQSVHEKINIYNLGNDSYITVNESIKIILNCLNLNPNLIYTGGIRGWVGDSPFIYLDCSKIKVLGWRPTISIEESIIKTVDFLEKHPFLLEMRG